MQITKSKSVGPASKTDNVQGVTASQPSNFKSDGCPSRPTLDFVIRHRPLVILPMIRVMNHEHAHRHISKSHPHMAELIRRSRRYEIMPSVSIRPFDALAESIAYQQLSGKAAATIWGRVRALYPKTKWLDPAKVLATPDEKASRRWSFACQNRGNKRSRGEDARRHRAIRARPCANER